MPKDGKEKYMEALNSMARNLTRQRGFVIAVIVVAVFIGMSLINPVFIGKGNLTALFIGISGELIIAVGMTIVMISGGFDMSVGSNAAFSGGIAAYLVVHGAPVTVAALAGIGTGLCIGMFNGYFISYMKIAPFVITLASMNIFRGLLVAMERGKSINNFPEAFNAIGQENFLGVQAPIWYAIIILIVFSILLKKFWFLRQCYYIGGNEKAAYLSGINVDKAKFFYYALIGLLAGLVGVVTVARFGAATTTTATGMEMRIITAVIVGGASLTGGAGSIIGTIFGCILMTSITNIVNLQGADVYWQTFITGATLFVAVFLDQVTKNNQSRRELRQAETLLRARSGKEKGKE
jgi:ribose transport system permease protein